MRNSPSRLTIVALAAVATFAAGCGGRDDDRAASTDTAAGTVAPPSSNLALAVSELKLGRRLDANQRVTDETDDFKGRDTVFASVVMNGATPSATLSAVWRFEDGQVIDSTAKMIAPTGESISSFYITKPDGFPKGKYTVTVLLNGVVAKHADFEVGD
jgi:hypothetical protein